jgi:transposase
VIRGLRFPHNLWEGSDEALRRRPGSSTEHAVSQYLEDWIGEDNPVRAIDVFVEELDLSDLGFVGVDPEATGRPSYHPSVLLKLYIYGYLNRVQSSRRLEREAGRNVEVMWLTGCEVLMAAFTPPSPKRFHTAKTLSGHRPPKLFALRDAARKNMWRST